MTELEQLKVQVDREVGNHTEAARMSALSMIGLGVRLATAQIGESSPVFTVVQANSLARDKVVMVLGDIAIAITNIAADFEVQSELRDEDAIADLDESVAERPLKSTMITAFRHIMTEDRRKDAEIISKLQSLLKEIETKFKTEA